MPLDHVNGEKISGLDSPHMLGSLLDWAGTQFMDIAAKHAEASFGLSGAKTPMIFAGSQVLIQMYPLQTPPVLAFLFCRTVGQQELFVPYKFVLSPEIVGELRVTGRWPSIN